MNDNFNIDIVESLFLQCIDAMDIDLDLFDGFAEDNVHSFFGSINLHDLHNNKNENNDDNDNNDDTASIAMSESSSHAPYFPSPSSSSSATTDDNHRVPWVDDSPPVPIRSFKIKRPLNAPSKENMPYVQYKRQMLFTMPPPNPFKIFIDLTAEDDDDTN